MIEQCDAIAAGATKVCYSVAGGLIVFGMTLNDVAVILGMLLGVATFLVNWFYKHKSYQLRKDQDEAN